MADASSVDFRALQLFIAVYDNQSFSVVARREGVSPSLISRTIQQLEDALGQQLFYRNTRAVVPTEAGRPFRSVRPGTAGTVRRRATGVTGSGTGPRRTGADQCAGLFWSAAYRPRLPELAARHPKLQFDLTLTDDFIDPHRDATDILFRISSLPDAGYHARVFGSQRYYLTASPEYVSRYGSPTSPEALHQHRTLVYGGSQGANRWLFRQREEAWVHYPLTPLMTSNNADALLTSAIGGMGIVLFPDWMVSEALHNGTLVTLMDRYSAAISHTPSYIAAIYPYTRHPSLNVRTVIDYLPTCLDRRPTGSANASFVVKTCHISNN